MIDCLKSQSREVMVILFRWAEVTVSDQVSYTKDICIETKLSLFVNERPRHRVIEDIHLQLSPSHQVLMDLLPGPVTLVFKRSDALNNR